MMDLSTLRRAILRGVSRSERNALGRPAVCLMVLPYANLRTHSDPTQVIGCGTGGFARVEFSKIWNTVVRTIREKLKM
jgi:hypothetical protein